MTKKSIKEIQPLSVANTPKRVLSNAPSVGVDGSNALIEVDDVSPIAKKIASEIEQQLSTNQVDGESAVGSLIDSILGYLDDGSEEQGEMKQFLETLVDDDPVLKADLLAILKR